MHSQNNKNTNPEIIDYTPLLTFNQHDLYLHTPLIEAKISDLLGYLERLETTPTSNNTLLGFFYQQLTLYFTFGHTNPQLAKTFAEKNLAIVNNTPLPLANATYLLGSAHSLNENYTDTTYFEHAYQLCEGLQKNDEATLLKARCLIQIARVKGRTLSNINESLHTEIVNTLFSLDEAINYLRSLGDAHPEIYYDLGSVMELQSRYRLACGEVTRAIVLGAGACTAWDTFTKHMGKAHPQSNATLVATSQAQLQAGDTARALKAVEEAYQNNCRHYKNEDHQSNAPILSALGDVYWQNHDARAIYYYEKALAICKIHHDKESLIYKATELTLTKATLFFYLQSCQYDWPEPCFASSLNPKADIILDFIQRLAESELKLDQRAQELLTLLMYKIGLYYIYICDRPSPVLLLLETLDDKMTGHAQAWLHNHIAYGYARLSTIESDQTLLAHYQQKHSHYAELVIETYREPKNDSENKILGFIGFVEGMHEYQRKQYNNALLNIGHCLHLLKADENQNDLTAMVNLYYASTYAAINQTLQAKNLFHQLYDYWQRPENIDNLNAITFYSRYADFLARERDRGDKEKAYTLYQKTFQLLSVHPTFSPQLKMDLKQKMLELASVLSKESGTSVLFKPASANDPKPVTSDIATLQFK